MRLAELLPVASADPAAGAEISHTVPAGKHWKLLSVAVPLVTSAVAGNRRVSLVFDDGTNVFWRGISPNDQAASLTHDYSWGLKAGISTGGTADTVKSSSLPELVLKPGYRIRTITAALDPTGGTGDNFGVARLYVVEFNAPPDLAA